MTFRELIGRVRQTVHEALDHQDYPLFLMVQHSHPVRNAKPIAAVRDVLFRAERGSAPGSRSRRTTLREPGELRFAPFPLDQLEGQFDLSVQLVERNGSWTSNSASAPTSSTRPLRIAS